MMRDIYRSAFQQNSEGMVALDLEGRITAVNPASHILLDLKEQDIGSIFFELNIFNRETNSRLVELFGEKRRENNNRDRLEKVVFKDGGWKWIRFRSNEIRSENGKVEGLMILASGQAERTDQERKLAEGEHKFKILFESLQEGVLIMDLKENILYANRAIGEILGMEPEELVGCNSSSFVEKKDLERIRKKAYPRGEGMINDHDITLKTGDGTLKNVNISAGPWSTKKGKMIGTIGLLLDVTKQKEVERALRSNEEKYKATVEQSAENIYIYDLDSKIITESNQTLQNLLGYSREEMKGLEPSAFIAHTEENIDDHIENVLKEGKVIIGERTYIRKDGTLVDVEVSASHIKDSDRSMLCVVSRDITERKKAREQLIEERNRVDFYLDLFVHDIGNIHHGMVAGLELYDMMEDDTDRKNNSIGIVKKLLKRSLKLVENIKTYTNLQSTKPDLKEMDLSQMMERGYESAITSFSNMEIEHGSLWDSNDYKIKAEPFLEEVFFNLYHNALKYHTDENAFVETTVKKAGDGFVRIEIADKGPGIPDPAKPMIFDRIKYPTAMQHTGVGLVIIDALVRRYGGRIWVEDRVAGNYKLGSVFKIEFPVIERSLHE